MLFNLLFEWTVNGAQWLISTVGIELLFWCLLTLSQIITRPTFWWSCMSLWFCTSRVPCLCLLTSFDFGRAYMKQRCRWSLVLYVRLDVYAKLITQPSAVTPKMDGKLVNFIWKLQLNAATWSDQFHFFTCITGRNLSNMTTPFLMEEGFYYMQFKLKEGFLCFACLQHLNTTCYICSILSCIEAYVCRGS